MHYFVIVWLGLSCVCAYKALRPSIVLNTKPEKQVIDVIEPTTGVTVRLIGTMHYNPSSIRKVTQTINQLGSSNNLGAVVLESCDRRWNKTLTNQPQSTFLRSLLDNEMQAASEAGRQFNAPVILADQNINITNTRMKETFLETVKDIATLRIDRIVADLRRVTPIVFTPPIDSLRVGQLNIADFLDPTLLIGLPISLLRYPLAIIIKSPPALVIGYFLTLGYSGYAADWSPEIMPGLSDTNPLLERLLEASSTSASILFELLLLGRTFAVALLEERNAVIAEGIRAACLDIKNSNLQSRGGNGLKGWFEQVVGSKDRASGGDSGDGGGKVVVAVLGAAHLNGIAALIGNEM